MLKAPRETEPTPMNQLARAKDLEPAPGDEAIRTDPAFILPDMTRTIADHAAGDDAETLVEAIARQRFRAENPLRHGASTRDAQGRRLGVTRRRIAERETRLARMPETRTVARPGAAPVSKKYRFMGWTMFCVALAMLTPIPLMVAIGMAEGAMTLTALIERPWLAMFYGLAPWGAVAALKLIRHALECEGRKTRLDIGLATGTLAAFALWVQTYSSTFLADTAAGPEAAFDAAGSMGTFYRIQLLLEVTAGYCAWTLSERLLAHGTMREVETSPTWRALLEAQAGDFDLEEAQASRLDAIDDAQARYDAAEADFVRTSLARLAGYAGRLASRSDAAASEARAATRADFIEGSREAAKEIP